MWKDENGRAPLGVFLGWILFLTILVELVLLALEPSAVAYAQDGKLTLGHAIYAVVGLLFSTPAPLIALYLTLRRAERISLREFLRRAVYTPRPLRAALVMGLFCAPALGFALCCGTPNGAAWYMLPLGFLVMLPFVGIAEETGWRGFLQPALEKRLPFPVATSVTAAIWYVWHLPLWLHPSSNHYGDSLIGFAMQIFVWCFAAAAIYRATKSSLACAAYHAFVNAIGAVWDWNALFDAWPKTGGMLLYNGIVLALVVGLWTVCDFREKRDISAKRRLNSSATVEG
ncbi:MAG: CPBP family intramembrane metalloprotease [Clostridia bacterium]|nr:CPBP family intramembrane metalloprotease [Clostridia bacterium]